MSGFTAIVTEEQSQQQQQTVGYRLWGLTFDHHRPIYKEMYTCLDVT